MHHHHFHHHEHKTFLRRFFAIEVSMLMQFSGIQAYAAYGVLIISGVFPDQANLIPMLINIEPIFTGMMTACLLVKFGRKTILQFGTLVTIIALLLTSIGFYMDNDQS